jgi:hypothetical protein
MARSETDPADETIRAVETTDAAYRDVESRVESIGEATVETVADAVAEAERLLVRYEGEATGTGGEEFREFVRMKRDLSEFVDGLGDDLRHRDAFEAAKDALDKRRVSESDFERARSTLAPARETAGLLDERREAREEYRDARRRLRDRLQAIEERIADREQVREYGAADLDADVGRLREPAERHNETVRAAFRSFKREAPAREVLSLVRTTERFPLVEFRQPPEDLWAYVRDSAAGTEPVPTLLEYADHSRSKLAHYVDDPAELKRRVATERTYLTGLDAEPLTVEWPPPEAGELRHRGREIVSVVGRFAADETVAAARRVRRLTVREDYRRLREAAVARARLTEADHRKLAAGEIEAELHDLRERRDALEAALEEYPSR